VSRTKTPLSAIFALAQLSFFQQSPHRTFLARTTENFDRVGRHRDDPGGITLHNPFPCISGPIWSFFSTSAGTDTRPRFDILVRMNLKLQDKPLYYKEPGGR
jgi:hypothetical protein